VLPRNEPIFFIMMFFLIFLYETSLARAENVFIKFYQEQISSADGDRCPMYPSCSAYASQAIEKHGPLIGWVMACDRLVRCGRDEVNLSKTIITSGRKVIFDPVDSNDFWWFENEKNK